MKENFQNPIENAESLREFKTADNARIIIPKSTEEHLLAHPEIDGILAEVLSKVHLPESGMLITEVNMDRILGRSARVDTPKCEMDEKILFAHRLHRAGPTRVVTNTEGPETDLVSVIAFPTPDQEKTYSLLTAWTGPLAPMEPWDKKVTREAFQKSLEFWRSHALVWDKEVMAEPFESTWAEVLEKYRKE